MRPHLLCCQGLAVYLYSFALDAADLQPPRLLQHYGYLSDSITGQVLELGQEAVKKGAEVEILRFAA